MRDFSLLYTLEIMRNATKIVPEVSCHPVVIIFCFLWAVRKHEHDEAFSNSFVNGYLNHKVTQKGPGHGPVLYTTDTSGFNEIIICIQNFFRVDTDLYATKVWALFNRNLRGEHLKESQRTENLMRTQNVILDKLWKKQNVSLGVVTQKPI